MRSILKFCCALVLLLGPLASGAAGPLRDDAKAARNLQALKELLRLEDDSKLSPEEKAVISEALDLLARAPTGRRLLAAVRRKLHFRINRKAARLSGSYGGRRGMEGISLGQPFFDKLRVAQGREKEAILITLAGTLAHEMTHSITGEFRFSLPKGQDFLENFARNTLEEMCAFLFEFRVERELRGTTAPYTIAWAKMREGCSQDEARRYFDEQEFLNLWENTPGRAVEIGSRRFFPITGEACWIFSTSYRGSIILHNVLSSHRKTPLRPRTGSTKEFLKAAQVYLDFMELDIAPERLADRSRLPVDWDGNRLTIYQDGEVLIEVFLMKRHKLLVHYRHGQLGQSYVLPLNERETRKPADGEHEIPLSDGRIVIPVKNGKVNGTVRKFDRTGAAVWEIPFRDDRADGLAKQFSGGKVFTSTFVNGHCAELARGWRPTLSRRRAIPVLPKEKIDYFKVCAQHNYRGEPEKGELLARIIGKLAEVPLGRELLLATEPESFEFGSFRIDIRDWDFHGTTSEEQAMLLRDAAVKLGQSLASRRLARLTVDVWPRREAEDRTATAFLKHLDALTKRLTTERLRWQFDRGTDSFFADLARAKMKEGATEDEAERFAASCYCEKLWCNDLFSPVTVGGRKLFYHREAPLTSVWKKRSPPPVLNPWRPLAPLPGAAPLRKELATLLRRFLPMSGVDLTPEFFLREATAALRGTQPVRRNRPEDQLAYFKVAARYAERVPKEDGELLVRLTEELEKVPAGKELLLAAAPEEFSFRSALERISRESGIRKPTPGKETAAMREATLAFGRSLTGQRLRLLGMPSGRKGFFRQLEEMTVRMTAERLRWQFDRETDSFFADLVRAGTAAGMPESEAEQFAASRYCEKLWRNDPATPVTVGGREVAFRPEPPMTTSPAPGLRKRAYTPWELLAPQPDGPDLSQKDAESFLRRLLPELKLDLPPEFFLDESNSAFRRTPRGIAVRRDGKMLAERFRDRDGWQSVRRYRADGTPAGLRKFHHGTRVSIEKQYSSQDTLTYIGFGLRDRKDGTFRESLADGGCAVEYTVQQGKLNGLYAEFDAAGVKLLEVPLKNGKAEGDGWVLKKGDRVPLRFIAGYARNAARPAAQRGDGGR